MVARAYLGIRSAPPPAHARLIQERIMHLRRSDNPRRKGRRASWWLVAALGGLAAALALPTASAQSAYAGQLLGGGFTSPAGVAVDGSGNVYLADQGSTAVQEMPAGCANSGCVTTLGGGFSSPSG